MADPYEVLNSFLATRSYIVGYVQRLPLSFPSSNSPFNDDFELGPYFLADSRPAYDDLQEHSVHL